MTKTNPLSFLGGMVIEVGAVIALLVVLLPGRSPANHRFLPEGQASANTVFYAAQRAEGFQPDVTVAASSGGFGNQVALTSTQAAPGTSQQEHLQMARRILPSTPCDVSALSVPVESYQTHTPQYQVQRYVTQQYQAQPVMRPMLPTRTALRSATEFEFRGRY